MGLGVMKNAATTAPALEVVGLRHSYGATEAVRDVNLTLRHGTRHALIGPNAAGKTTLLKLIAGSLQPSAGTLRLGGEDVTQLSRAARRQRGVARTFRLNRLLRELTVLETVYLTIRECAADRDGSVNAQQNNRALIEQALDHLESLALVADAHRPVRDLPVWRQRLVEIAIALAQHPTLLLLDEPTDGVPPPENRPILDLISGLGPDMTVLLIEHNLDVVVSVTEYVTVLIAGAVAMQGSSEAMVARRANVERTFSRLSPGALKTMSDIVTRQADTCENGAMPARN
jgi:branched-chain amino acid transport system ATP-binding protein